MGSVVFALDSVTQLPSCSSYTHQLALLLLVRPTWKCGPHPYTSLHHPRASSSPSWPTCHQRSNSNRLSCRLNITCDILFRGGGGLFDSLSSSTDAVVRQAFSAVCVFSADCGRLTCSCQPGAGASQTIFLHGSPAARSVAVKFGFRWT